MDATHMVQNVYKSKKNVKLIVLTLTFTTRTPIRTFINKFWR
jgi:hypothetical protein